MPRVKKAAELQGRDSNLDSFKLYPTCRVKESLPRGAVVCAEFSTLLAAGLLAVSSEDNTKTTDGDLF